MFDKVPISHDLTDQSHDMTGVKDHAAAVSGAVLCMTASPVGTAPINLTIDL